jgi:hypothetical protein
MKEDDLLRSALVSASQAESSIRVLIAQNKEDLYRSLAQHVMGVSEGSPLSSSFGTSFSTDDLLRDEETSNLGRRTFRRWSRAYINFVAYLTRKSWTFEPNCWPG